MRYLLYTHTLLWIAADDPRLSQKAEFIFLDDANEIYFSLASLWEIAIKVSLGRLALEEPLPLFMKKHITGNGIIFLHIETEHILPLASLPHHHKDPFDRLIISQALVENIPIIGKDEILDLYPIERIW